jgi:hypothetical protein
VNAGAAVRIRATHEPAVVLAVVDGAGSLLVRVPGEEPFLVARDDVLTDAERHSCGCCG